MSKMKDWLIEMEEDAILMDRDAWCEKHGESVIEIWNDVRSRAAKATDIWPVEDDWPIDRADD